MIAANKVKMSSSEKKKAKRNTCDISSIKRVIRKFPEASRCSPAKTMAKKCTKKNVLQVQSTNNS